MILSTTFMDDAGRDGRGGHELHFHCRLYASRKKYASRKRHRSRDAANGIPYLKVSSNQIIEMIICYNATGSRALIVMPAKRKRKVADISKYNKLAP